MHNYSKNTSRDTVSESEIYEDLSEALSCFKQKLQDLASKSAHQYELTDQKQSNSEQTSAENLKIIKEKYKEAQISPRFQIIIQRFIVRLKENIRQVATLLPKIKVDLMISIRKLELNAVKSCESQNYQSAICLILEYIHNFSLQSLANRSNLAARTHNKSVMTCNPLKPQPEMLANNHSAQNLKGKRETEAEQFIRNAQKYACVDIDIEYLRGRYFDLKQQDHQLLQDAYARNSYIKRTMSSFQKLYQISKERGLSNKSKCHNKSKAKTYYLKSNSLEQPMRQNDEDSFFKSTKENDYFSQDSQQRKKQRIHTQANIEVKVVNQTFRSVYQEKLKQRKTNGVKMKNIAVIICDDDSTQYVKNVNSKRMQFFKKSQQQTRLRYKYYNYVRKEAQSTSNHSMKNKSIYPQAMFSTLAYK